MIKRIQDYLKSIGKTVTWLESECEFAKGTLSKALAKDTHIGSDKLVKIFQVLPELNARFVILGTGDMLLLKVEDANGVRYQDKAEWYAEKYLNKDYENMGMKERIKELERELKKYKEK